MDPRELYEANLELIDRIITIQCHRNACYGAEAEDFRGEVHVKLLENGGHRLAKCKDPESLRSFLAVVIGRLFLDYRNHRWGKFRVSAAAHRLGAPAPQLETLLRRDGWGLEEAIRILRENLGFEHSVQELRELAERLSRKPRRRFESEEGLEGLAVQGGAGDLADENERIERAKRVREVLARILQGLDAEDRLLLKMRFRDGLKVSDIARALGHPQRPLYSRLEKLFNKLKSLMADEGLDAEQVLSTIGWDGWRGLLDDSEDDSE